MRYLKEFIDLFDGLMGQKEVLMRESEFFRCYIFLSLRYIQTK